MIKFKNGCLYLNNQKIFLKLFLDDSIKRVIHEDYVKGYYSEDIDRLIDEEGLKNITEEDKKRILDKYFDMREDANYPWQECLDASFIYVLGYNYKKGDYKK